MAQQGLYQQLQQRQSLVMTPQLQQSIKLLQMSTLDLAGFVEQQMVENPLLVDGDIYTDNADETSPEKTRESADTEPHDTELDLQHYDKQHSLLDQDQGLDSNDRTNWAEQANSGNAQEAGFTPENTSATLSQPPQHSTGGGGVSAGEVIEQTHSEDKNLRDHVMEQFTIDETDPAKRMIANAIIDTLDEAGYITESIDTLCTATGATPEQIEDVIHQLQACDPAGICARSLTECLRLQLQERNHLDPAIDCLLEHLDLLAEGKLVQLQRLCEVDAEDLRHMIAEIRTLDPKPGLAFIHDPDSDPVRPDVFVSPDNKEGWSITLNNDMLPRVLVDRHYYAEISGKARGASERSYLSEQYQHASWLVKALDQRARTILKVSAEIVKQQEMFFKYGVNYLKPLTLKQVADAVELHESTVSRVTSNKYMHTPRGLVELKYFFASGVSSELAEDGVSSVAVKSYIRELVDNESPKKILSDDKLKALLHAKGIDIARRTVAKYREALGYGSSVERRRQKRLSQGM